MSRFERWSQALLRILRLPPEPTPPFGAAGSVRVFRAGRNFYRLRLLVWGTTQVSTLAGLIVAIGLLHQLERDVESARSAAVVESPGVIGGQEDSGTRGRDRRLPAELVQFAEGMPSLVFTFIKIGEAFGVIAFVLQIPFTYAAVRLDFELRWYIVTDRSLRIRSGIFKVQESTMSFANIQQVVVSQGPLQRLLGIADLRVQSAGGGGGGGDDHERGESLHTGIFHGVDNATEIRDLILERLRRFREAGLGDPDDAALAPASHAPEAAAGAVDAAKRVLAEARSLRHAISGSPGA